MFWYSAERKYDHHSSSRAVIGVWVFLPVVAVGLYEAYRWLIDFFCGEQDDVKVHELQHLQQSNTKAIAPILTRLPQNFRFANYVTENESVSSDWPSSALSLNKAIHVPNVLLLPCSLCTGDGGQNKAISKLTEVDHTVPSHERPSSISKHSAKMAHVAEWLLAQSGGDGKWVPAQTRGAALLGGEAVSEQKTQQSGTVAQSSRRSSNQSPQTNSHSQGLIMTV